jgi:hypothetical protein
MSAYPACMCAHVLDEHPLKAAAENPAANGKCIRPGCGCRLYRPNLAKGA